MAKRKGDIEIGQRAYDEVCRVFGSAYKAAKITRLKKRLFYYWQDGGTPGGYALAVMHYHGCDVLYILTGKRQKT